MTYFDEFINATYPGAKKSPVEMVKMMATPEIKPDVTLAGKLPSLSKKNSVNYSSKIEIALCCIPCLLYNLIAASIMNANSGAAAKCASSTNSSPKKDGKSHKGRK